MHVDVVPALGGRLTRGGSTGMAQEDRDGRVGNGGDFRGDGEVQWVRSRWKWQRALAAEGVTRRLALAAEGVTRRKCRLEHRGRRGDLGCGHLQQQQRSLRK